DFWASMWEYTGVIAERHGEIILRDGDKMPGARFFPEARLNFAENLLRRRDDAPAVIFRGEDQVRRTLSHAELYDQVSRLSQALRAEGVRPGDRVAGYVPNTPEALIGMLATAAIGAVWSSCSPDFGVQGVLDRFGQIEPKVLISADGYFYNGKRHDSIGKLKDILARLPGTGKAVVFSYTAEPDLGGLDRGVTWDDFVAPFQVGDIEFEQLPFNHPLYIMYSSGTTGVPKCIVHGAGGTLLQHLKEHRLHVDVKRDDRLFYFTTCGWMMWNWLVTGLASEACLVLYDGSPFHPDGNAMFDFIDEAGINYFGTSAKFIDAVAKAGLSPRKTHDLGTLRTIMSTGSPLVPEGFDFVYEHIKSDLCLSSISGGTDLIACFACGNPALPVWRGEIQCKALGMAVEALDENGNPLPPGKKGELACVKPFPSMPIYFWNDEDGSRYRKAYFETVPGVWCHGDYVEITEHDGVIIYGRSDATLNPGGVRIGTAEIYRQAEQLDEVVESIVIGQQWKGDVRVVLFVRLRDGVSLDEDLIQRIRKQIRENTTPRHVPAKILQVDDIPRTKSGKIVELAVRSVVHGEPVKNKEALANPEALELFAGRSELETD
ncbi:MAG TPA: acetoacetate--CoA ligase, partial [Arenicellales bacterium]|nr:acetoacetate--CoA ligase [Arenicellales bacterium]